jgi:hypothetical protein
MSQRKRKAASRAKFPFQVDGGHVVVDVEGVKVLLDTGAQVSFGRVPTLAFMGETHGLPQDCLGRCTTAELVDGLRRHTPVSPAFDFEALLGLDILAGRTITLDWVRGVLTVEGSGTGAGTTRNGPLPGTTVVGIGGAEMAAFIDTGAWRTYLVPEVAERMARTGKFQDYNPLLGVLSPDLVGVDVDFQGHRAALFVGVATDGLAMAIRGGSAKVLIGTDILVPTGEMVMEIPAA